MRLSDIQYTEFTGKHVAIACGGIAVFCMAAGLFQQFFSNLIFILLCIIGTGGAGYLLFLKHKQFNAPVQPVQKMPRPIIFNLVRDSAEIDEDEIIKLAGVDKMYQQSYAGADQMPDLLQKCLELDCLLIFGGRGSGKTNFIQHLAREKVYQGEEIWLIDPKPAKPGKWKKEINVIGHGHNYPNIIAVSEKYDFELECRKKQFQNVNDFPKVTLVVDELYLLNLKIPGFMNMILPLLLEGREYNIHMIIISQSKTAGSLGLKGHYDVLSCFDAIIELDRRGPKDNPRSYHGYIDTGKGNIECRIPGAYRPGRTSNHNNTSQSQYRTPNNPIYGHDTASDTQDKHDTPTLNFDQDSGEYVYQQQRFYDSRMEKVVVELFINNPNISYNAICNHIWGASNGRRIKQIKDILRKHNCLR